MTLKCGSLGFRGDPRAGASDALVPSGGYNGAEIAYTSNVYLNLSDKEHGITAGVLALRPPSESLKNHGTFLPTIAYLRCRMQAVLSLT